jgi:hypothetical protein
VKAQEQRCAVRGQQCEQIAKPGRPVRIPDAERSAAAPLRRGGGRLLPGWTCEKHSQPFTLHDVSLWPPNPAGAAHRPCVGGGKRFLWNIRSFPSFLHRRHEAGGIDFGAHSFSGNQPAAPVAIRKSASKRGGTPRLLCAHETHSTPSFQPTAASSSAGPFAASLAP